MRIGSALTLCLLALLAPRASAQDEVPGIDGWVNDLAGLLDAQQELALESLMESFKQGSTHEIALLTVPDLGGQPIERLALTVGREWGLGTEERNNGALLLVAAADRKIRIEVGRGLEGTLTDSICGRIIREVIAPHFKRGNFYVGLRAGIEAMHAAAGGEYGRIPRGRGRHSPASALVGAMTLIFLFMMLGLLSRHGGGSGRSGGVGGILPWILLGSAMSGRRGWSGGFHGGLGGGMSGGGFGGGFSGFGGGGGFSGGGSSGGW